MNIITYWTFDLFHFWHLELLRRCKELSWGWLLYVWVSTDEFNSKKWKKCIIPYEQRKAIVESIKYVDFVIQEYDWSQKEIDLKLWNTQMVMWDDWKWKFDDLWCIYLPRTPWISSSQIKVWLF